jgi:hypothetical protein
MKPVATLRLTQHLYLSALLVFAAACSSSSSSPRPSAGSAPAPAAPASAACPDPKAAIDCAASCDGYQHMIDDLSRDPKFAGDPLSRSQCLAQCAAPTSVEQHLEFACYVGAMDAKTSRACIDRCRSHAP